MSSNAIKLAVDDFDVAVVGSGGGANNQMWIVAGTDNIYRDNDVIQHFCYGTHDDCSFHFNTPPDMVGILTDLG